MEGKHHFHYRQAHLLMWPGHQGCPIECSFALSPRNRTDMCQGQGPLEDVGWDGDFPSIACLTVTFSSFEGSLEAAVSAATSLVIVEWREKRERAGKRRWKQSDGQLYLIQRWAEIISHLTQRRSCVTRRLRPAQQAKAGACEFLPSKACSLQSRGAHFNHMSFKCKRKSSSINSLPLDFIFVATKVFCLERKQAIGIFQRRS